MIRSLAALLSCQLAGEALSHALHLPVPGPVIGLVLLFAALQFLQRRDRRDAAAPDAGETGRLADALLRNLALLFVPAGVGVIQHLDLLRAHGLALVLALVVSTVATLLVTVLVFLLVARLLPRQAE